MIEDLEKKLYGQSRGESREKESPSAQNEPIGRRAENGFLSRWEQKNGEAPGDKETMAKTLKRGARTARILFWILTAGAVVGLGLLGFYLFQYSGSQNISLTLSAPKKILIGVPFELEANFENNSENILEDARLNLILPEDVVSREERNKRTIVRNLGDQEPASNIKTKIPLVIFKQNESVIRITATVSYLPQALGPKTRFEKTESIDIAVKEPAVKIDLSAPQKVLNGENFEIRAEYENASDTQFNDFEITLDLPSFFRLKEADPQAASGNIWRIAGLDKNAKGVITLRGNVLAKEQSFFDIKASLKSGGGLVDEKTISINVSPSPLALNISLNNQENYIARSGENLKYAINYQNNAEVGLNDAVIKARLAGEMFDFKTLRTRGSFNSLDNTISWNTASIPELRLLAPGASGAVDFDVATKQTYPIRRLADKNFVLKIDAEISSPTVPYYVAADKTISLARLETKVAGQVQIQSKAFYYDPGSEIVNSGPIPPRVNKSTTYTIHWQIVNYSTDVKNVEVKAFLAGGVRFTGKTKSNTTSTPIYNERTGEVNWAIDRLPAGRGVLSKPLEIRFQIEATPNVTQIGQPMPLMGEVALKAIDDFTSLRLTSSALAITSQLPNDPGIGVNGGIVVQ